MYIGMSVLVSSPETLMHKSALPCMSAGGGGCVEEGLGSGQAGRPKRNASLRSCLVRVMRIIRRRKGTDGTV